MTDSTAPLPIFDGHNDFLGAIHSEEGRARRFFERGDTGHLDYVRAREGGFAGGMFAVFVGSEPTMRSPVLFGPEPEQDEGELAAPIDTGYALRACMAMAATLRNLALSSEGRLEMVRTHERLRSCLASGTMAAVLHFEGAEAIDPELNNLEVFYEAGLRSLGIVWSRPNLFGEGVPFRFPGTPDTGPGLSRRGKALVHRCNELGIVVDLSHLNARGFWDVAAISSQPLVASHSNAHSLTPSPRNLLDSQLDAIASSDGLVGVNFSVSFIRDDGKDDPDTPLEHLVRHIDYLCEHMGVDHVALGSDFDGATVPAEMRDVAGLPRLVSLLKERGYSETDLAKVCRENWVRVLGSTWK